jgi:carboxymethylenebutenolidase
MGGGWALWLTVQKPEDVAAVVVFYSTGAIDFSKAQASFLGHFSPDDEWEPVADVRATEEKIRGAGKEVTFHFYPGTKHWFVEENRPVEYNRAASDLAWKRTLEFLNGKLQ